MQEVLQTQLDFSQNLVKTLQTVVASYSTLVTNTQTQSDKIVGLVQEIDKSKDRMNRLLAKSQKLADDLNSSLSINYVKNIQKRSANSQEAFNVNVSDMQKQFSMFFNMMSNNTKDFDKLTRRLKLSQRQISQISKMRESFGSFNKDLDNISDDVDQTTDSLETFEEIGEKANVAKNAVMTGGTSLLIDIPKMLFGLMSTATNAFTSFVGAATKFYAFALTLPFTISQIAVKLGNAIRSDLVEVIQAGGEEAKEVFDLTSDIGKSANKMTQNVKGMLKEFQNPRGRLAQIFGAGASGIAAFQKESFTLVDSMGHFAEVYGPSILGNTKTAQFMIEANRALAIGAQESAYYALDAYTTGKNPVEYVAELADKIKTVADNNELDTKQIAIQFHKLKTNIVDFGHLTSNEVLNLVTKLTKMRVSSEDAVNVFKKFTSLEEATKSSAMLFQSFNMNIDAFDLLTARDPAEMLTQFKNAMQATGKSFESLDRHEKALMKSITGISEQGLSSLMSSMDVNMSYEEARKKMDQHNPTKKKTKLINSLSSSIKMFQKTLQFSSPFDAFFQGLSENALSQKELQGRLINFNKVYESIYKIAFDLKPAEVEAFTKPVVAVLSKIKNIFLSGDFLKLTKLVTKTTADFMSDFAIDLYSQKDAKNFHTFRLKVNETFENLGNKQSATIKAAMLKTTESELVRMKNFLDSKEVPESLKFVFKKNKQGIYRIAKGASLDSVLSAITSASENLPKDSRFKSSLEKLRFMLDDTYIKEIESINATKSMQEAQKSVQKRTSVTGRIDRLYDNLINMFTEGGPLFKQFHDTAGRIMGAMITGAMEGTIALINLFNGGVDQSVSQLGLATEKELERQFGKKDVTLLEYLGIGGSDIAELEQGLAKESSRFVDNLPSLMSMAGSLFGDLTDLFSTFALSVVGLIGGFSIAYFDKASVGEKTLMVGAGFDPAKARVAAAKAKGVDKIDESKSIISNLIKIDKYSNKTKNPLETQVASTYQLVKSYTASLDKRSFAYSYLNSLKVKDQLDYILNIGNSAIEQQNPFQSYSREASKMSGILDVLYIAKGLESILPSSLLKNQENSKNKYINDYIEGQMSYQEHYLDQALSLTPNKSITKYRGQSSKEKFPKYFKYVAGHIKDSETKSSQLTKDLNKLKGIEEKDLTQDQKFFTYLFEEMDESVFGEDYNKKNDTIIDKYLSAIRFVTSTVSNEIDDLPAILSVPLTVPSSIIRGTGEISTILANDFYAKEKNMKVLIGNKIFSLNEEDTLVAFKSGGYFDNLFRLSDNKINLLTSENLQIKVENSNLKKVVQEVELNIENQASEDDLSELFILFNEVTNLLDNREIIVEEPQIVFN